MIEIQRIEGKSKKLFKFNSSLQALTFIKSELGKKSQVDQFFELTINHGKLYFTSKDANKINYLLKGWLL